MKANDFCPFCGAHLNETDKNHGRCGVCSETWEVCACDACGDCCARNNMRRTNSGDLVCENCAAESGELF